MGILIDEFKCFVESRAVKRLPELSCRFKLSYLRKTITTAMRNILFTLILVAFAYAAQAQSAPIPFQLANGSGESIQLIIPGKSKTTVKARSICEMKLTKGQKIFFLYQGKQYSLLTVTEQLEDQKLDLNSLVTARKQQIDYSTISR